MPACCWGQVQSNAGYSQQVLPVQLADSQVAQSQQDVAESAALRVKTAVRKERISRLVHVDPERLREYGVLTDGDFSKAVSKDGPAPTTGSIGLNYTVFLPATYSTKYRITPADGTVRTEPTDTVVIDKPERLEPYLSLNLVFSLGSRGDTLLVKPDTLNVARPLNQRDFGQSMLLPGSNSATNLRSISISGRYYPFSWWVKRRPFRPLAFGVDVGGATTRWGTSARQISEFTLLSGTGRAYYTLANTLASPDNELSVRIDLFTGLAYRSFRGDIREEPAILTQALGMVGTYTFWGWETGVQASVNALRFSATWSSFGNHIRGFSNGQLILNVGFSNALRFSKKEKF